MFDPLGVAARDVRECLLIQLRTLAPDNTLAQQIVSDHLKQLQNKQYREIARALDRPVKAVERCVEIIRKLDPRPGQRFNTSQTRLIEPDVAFVRTGDGYQVILNEDGLPQLRLSHHYRRMLGEDGTTREVRNYVKERFTSAIQLIKNIEQRKQTIIRVCEVDHPPPERIPRQGHRPTAAHDDQGSGGRSGRASLHRQPRRRQ